MNTNHDLTFTPHSNSNDQHRERIRTLAQEGWESVDLLVASSLQFFKAIQQADPATTETPTLSTTLSPLGGGPVLNVTASGNFRSLWNNC